MAQTQRSRELAREIERERCKPNKIHTQERGRERDQEKNCNCCFYLLHHGEKNSSNRGGERAGTCGGVELQAKGSVALV